MNLLYGALITGAVSIAFSASAHAQAFSPELQGVIERAKAEGELLLKSPPSLGAGADGAEAARIAIEEMFGVKLNVRWAPTGPLAIEAAKMNQQLQAKQPPDTDVFLSSPAYVVPYLDKGLFKTVNWAALMPDRIRPEFVEGDGRALRLETWTPGIFYNVQQASWVKEIKAADDLLKPQYKGKFATTPFLAGFDYLLAIPSWGVERTTKYVTALRDQVSGFVGCSAPDRIMSGEIPAVFFDCHGGFQNKIRYRERGGVDTLIVPDAAYLHYLYGLVPSLARNPNAATLFVLYLASPKGQVLLYDNDGQDMDGFAQSRTGKAIAAERAKGIQFGEMTLDWWQKQPFGTNESAMRQLTRIIEKK